MKYKPVKLYRDCSALKNIIFEENKDKLVVYTWVNNISGKKYVGSTVNFKSRFYKYYNTSYLNKHKTPLHNALLKYGYSNFSLEILEYCTIKNIIPKEQFYINLIKPEYNILQIAGSSLGFKHKDETLIFFRQERKLSEQAKNKLKLAASKRIFSDKEKENLSSIRKGIKLSDVTKKKISKTISSISGIPVTVLNLKTKVEKHYISLTEAAKDIGVSRTAVKKAYDSKKVLKKEFLVKK